MGTRLHEMMGYGLTNIASEEHRIADPRINNDSFWIYGKEPEQPYDKWLRSKLTGDEMADIELHLELAMMEDTKGGPADAREACKWDRESRCRDGVLLLRPVGYTGWSRYGDGLDTQEEYALHDGWTMKNRVVPLRYGIYPFSVGHMDARTGRSLKETVVDFWRRAADSEDLNEEQRAKALLVSAKALGFDSHEEAEQHVAPVVPDEIRRLAEWGELFTGPDVWRQLRPMISCWWG